LNVFFFHENPKNKSEFSAFATFSRPLKNVQICSSSRKAKILTADIH
jgi:hypothetical protein